MYTPIPAPCPPPETPHYVWPDVEDTPWARHVYFRRELTLERRAALATFGLFASTEYHLLVNGTLVGTGPVRGFVDRPAYDTYDLAPFLREGDNVIAVEVQHVGHATFQNPYKPPALVCWGRVESPQPGEAIDLDSGRHWRCCVSSAHEPYPPRFSFAIGPTMLYDARKAPAGWAEAGEPAGDWATPVAAPHAGDWGPLEPRPIPHLTQRERQAERLCGAYRHAADRNLGFLAHVPFDPREHFRMPDGTFVAWTYVQSPDERKELIRTRWGEWYLNGSPIPADRQDPAGEVRTLRLEKGWSLLVMTYRSTLGSWPMQLGLAADSPLRFSPEKHQADTDDDRVYLSPPMTPEQRDELVRRLHIADRSANPPEGWREVTLRRDPVPVFSQAWAVFAETLAPPSGEVRPVELPVAPGGSAIYDLGRIGLGRVFVEFEAPAGTIVDVGFAEDLRGDRPAHLKMALVHSAERHVARGGGPERFETFMPRGCRYLQVDLRGEQGTARIARTGMVETVYPYDWPASFACSDGALTSLWEWGRRTLGICSEDAVLDTPWRERGCYGGDLLAEWGTMLATTGDGRLIRRCVDMYFQAQNPQTGWLPPRAPNDRSEFGLGDYALLVGLIGEWYCRALGDVEFARDLLGRYERLIEGMLAFRGDDGIYRIPCGVFVAHKYGHKKSDGAHGTFNALACRSLRAFATLLEMTGEASRAADFRARADEASAKLNEHFWNEADGTFCDELLDGEQVGRSIYAAAWALLFADVEPDRARRAVEHIDRLLDAFDPAQETVSPYGAFYVLGALYKHAAPAVAQRVIAKVYEWMLREPTGTTWEHGDPGKSLSHAWASAPTFYASSRILGVRLGWPDCDDPGKVHVAPETSGITWAEGTVPHPAGLVTVRWDARGAVLTVDVQAPDGVEVDVAPRGELAELELRSNVTYR